ncbi:MAG: MOSC domain-containing protein, partial [Chloroflexota bacterium]
MPQVAALYRYPLKGFTPESCNSLTILPSGQVAGDRVLGVRFADTPAPDDAWSPKREMLVLMNTPGLARLGVTFDHERQRIRLEADGIRLADAALDRAGRNLIAGVLEQFVELLDEQPLRDHPERLPLRVIGDGRTPRFHDNEAGQVTLHGRLSVQALGEALGETDFSELRFRSNIAIDGLPAWEELSWKGQTVQIGSVSFSVVKEKVRCLATHANPRSGLRDQPVMTTLTERFGQDSPMMGVSLVPTAGGGVITLHDPV